MEIVHHIRRMYVLILWLDSGSYDTQMYMAARPGLAQHGRTACNINRLLIHHLFLIARWRPMSYCAARSDCNQCSIRLVQTNDWLTANWPQNRHNLKAIQIFISRYKIETNDSGSHVDLGTNELAIHKHSTEYSGRKRKDHQNHACR